MTDPLILSIGNIKLMLSNEKTPTIELRGEPVTCTFGALGTTVLTSGPFSIIIDPKYHLQIVVPDKSTNMETREALEELAHLKASLDQAGIPYNQWKRATPDQKDKEIWSLDVYFSNL